MSSEKELLNRARKWAKERGRSLATLGNNVVDNARVFRTLEQGKRSSMSMATYAKIDAWLVKEGF